MYMNKFLIAVVAVPVSKQSCFPMLTRQRSILLRHPVLIRTAVSVRLFRQNNKK